MFVIVFICVRKAVKEMSFFSDAAGWAVAFCVALLSIMGLLRFLGSPGLAPHSGGEPRETGGLIDVVLLPYGVLALTILLAFLLLGASRVLRGREPSHSLKGARSHSASTKPCARAGGLHPQETRLPDLPDRRQIVGRKNGEMLRQPEGGR
jgi:hypothetical protein